MAIIDKEPTIDRGAHLPNRKSKKFVSLFLVVVIAMSLMAMTALLRPQESDIAPSEPPTPARIAYTTHAPIVIDGDAGFLGDYSSTGISWGSGTIYDPYIIENLDIDASSAHGIEIENANMHFVIRDCIIHDGGSDFNGITFKDCTNGTASGNNCSGNRYGIYLYSSSNNMLDNNNCSNCVSDGVYLYFLSDNNTVDNNNCSDNASGIDLHGSSYNTIVNNTCNSNTREGMDFDISNNNTVNSNTCSSNNGEGIFLWWSSNNTINGNTCSANLDPGIMLTSASNNNTIKSNTCNANMYGGVELVLSNDNIVNDNICLDNTPGIDIWTSNKNTISNNDCSNGVTGIRFYESTNNTLANNTCNSNMGSGIDLTSSSNNTMVWNQLNDNSLYGVYIKSGSFNMVWNNTFVGNNGAGSTYDSNHIQAFDDGTNNRWNCTEGYGNYWSDWTTPDLDSNGIVDAPYNLDGSEGAEDHYPRTTPTVIPEFSSPVIVVVSIAVMVAVFVASGKSSKRSSERRK
jgi:parallel beta-helix repeat protein